MTTVMTTTLQMTMMVNAPETMTEMMPVVTMMTTENPMAPTPTDAETAAYDNGSEPAVMIMPCTPPMMMPMTPQPTTPMIPDDASGSTKTWLRRLV